VSVSGASFSSDAVYTGAQAGYIAYESGTFADDCSIGVTTPLGQWHSNTGQTGTFQMKVLSGSVPTTSRKLAAAIKVCDKLTKRKKRAACIKAAKKKY